MTYAEIIKTLYTESGLPINQYAEKIRSSLTNLSNVLNGKQPGSIKMVEACVRAAGKDIQDYLSIPEEFSPEEQAKINKLLYILRNDPRGKEGIEVNIDYIYEESRRQAHKRHKDEAVPQSRGHPERKRKGA